MIQLTKEIADEIYTVLVEECGAFEGDKFCPYPSRENYIRLATQPDGRLTEYRFQGDLGFGGKVWNCNGRFYVSCYSENETPELRRKIEKANERLAEVYKRAVAESI